MRQRESIPAILALENGRIFRGEAAGALGSVVGETVFNTAMTGYQEILTDPSYCQQLVTLTTPHIGNVGVNAQDEEASTIHAAGLILHDLPSVFSNWRAESSLQDYLKRANVVAIAGIDTRALTQYLRTEGAQRGCILADPYADAEVALGRARAFSGLLGTDLARVVSTSESYQWHKGVQSLGSNDSYQPPACYKVVAYDFGVKRNILRLLVEQGCEIIVVPADTPADKVLAMGPDGVFLSNGPGDPQPCHYAINATRVFLDREIPLFGICLGHQILALACGAQTVKMKFGHHGANHPVKELRTGRVLITSQNHGFAVDESSLPNTLSATHLSLFDSSLQGIESTDSPAFGFQGHPEASPGPHDANDLFVRFISTMERYRECASAL